MKNVTLAIDDEVLAEGRKYAEQHGTTLNDLMRDLLARTVMPDRAAMLKEMLRLMDENPGDSGGWKWNREELYDRNK